MGGKVSIHGSPSIWIWGDATTGVVTSYICGRFAAGPGLLGQCRRMWGSRWKEMIRSKVESYGALPVVNPACSQPMVEENDSLVGGRLWGCK